MSTEVLTVQEAGARLGLSRPSAYKAARSGAIPVIRIGGKLIVPRAAIDRLLQIDNGKSEGE